MSSVPGLCLTSAFSDRLHVFSEVLPDTPEEIDPKFTLYTRDKRDTSLSFTDMSTLAHFNPSKNTFIIVHGLRSSGDTDWVNDMTSSLLDEVLHIFISVSRPIAFIKRIVLYHVLYLPKYTSLKNVFIQMLYSSYLCVDMSSHIFSNKMLLKFAISTYI